MTKRLTVYLFASASIIFGSSSVLAQSPNAALERFYRLQNAAGITDIPGEKISFSSITPLTSKQLIAGEGEKVTVNAYLELPEGATGPVPVVIILNCGDTVKTWKDIHYAKAMRKAGYATFLVNSFENRDTSANPRRALVQLRHASAVDAFQALKTLAKDPRIDPKRIAVLGWANGGAVVLSAMIEELRAQYVGGDLRFAAAVPIQAMCSIGSIGKSYSATPILALHGARDDFMPASHCESLGKEIRAAGANFNLAIYPDAGHQWDHEGFPLAFVQFAPSFKSCSYVTDFRVNQMVIGDKMVPFDDPNKISMGSRHFHACAGGGTYWGYHEATRTQAINDVVQFLATSFSATNR
jgi:dienelactone hydrolase